MNKYKTKSSSKWAHTFNWWFLEEPSEVIMVDPSEYETHQSEYLLYYSYLRSKGWKRDNRKWVSPDGTYRFTHIHAAYRCAKFYDEIIWKPK